MDSRRSSLRSGSGIPWLFVIALSSAWGTVTAESEPSAETMFATPTAIDFRAVRTGAAAATRRPAPRSQTPGEWKRLENRQVGYTLLYPADWSVEGQVAATEFAVGSQCQSVRVVDSQPAPDSGSGARMQQSFLQVCAQRIVGAESLQDFMRRSYGARFARIFEAADVEGLFVYRSKDREGQPATMLFTEIKGQRIQVYCSVAADVAKFATRMAQVEDILASFAAI
jgi:hypothetical protein